MTRNVGLRILTGTLGFALLATIFSQRASAGCGDFAWFSNDAANAPFGIGNPTGPTRILQQITLSADGNHYSGTFALDAYDTSGDQIVHLVGVIAATRITLDTTVPDLL